jgi:hypothetical protein
MISSIAGGNAAGLGEYYINEQQYNLVMPANSNQVTPLQSAYSQLNEFDPSSMYNGSEYSRRYSDYI